MASSGYIIEAKGGPGERPIHSRSEGTERVAVHLGMFVPPPPPLDPPVFGAMVTWEIPLKAPSDIEAPRPPVPRAASACAWIRRAPMQAGTLAPHPSPSPSALPTLSGRHR
jgi:hypothetical protein